MGIDEGHVLFYIRFCFLTCQEITSAVTVRREAGKKEGRKGEKKKEKEKKDGRRKEERILRTYFVTSPMIGNSPLRCPKIHNISQSSTILDLCIMNWKNN